MTITSKHVYYGMVGLLVLLVAGIFGTSYLALGQLQHQADKLVDYKLQNKVLEAEQTNLVKAKKDISTYRELESIAKVIVPQDKDQALAVREIVKLASASGIQPSSITFPASTLGATTGAAVVPGSGVPTASGKNGLSQLTPVKDIKNVYNLQITIQQDAGAPVPYDRFLDFLQRLEQNRRTAQVSSVVLRPDTKDHNLVSFTLVVDEYIKP